MCKCANADMSKVKDEDLDSEKTYCKKQKNIKNFKDTCNKFSSIN